MYWPGSGSTQYLPPLWSLNLEDRSQLRTTFSKVTTFARGRIELYYGASPRFTWQPEILQNMSVEIDGERFDDLTWTVNPGNNTLSADVGSRFRELWYDNWSRNQSVSRSISFIPGQSTKYQYRVPRTNPNDLYSTWTLSAGQNRFVVFQMYLPLPVFTGTALYATKVPSDSDAVKTGSMYAPGYQYSRNYSFSAVHGFISSSGEITSTTTLGTRLWRQQALPAGVYLPSTAATPSQGQIDSFERAAGAIVPNFRYIGKFANNLSPSQQNTGDLTYVLPPVGEDTGRGVILVRAPWRTGSSYAGAIVSNLNQATVTLSQYSSPTYTPATRHDEDSIDLYEEQRFVIANAFRTEEAGDLNSAQELVDFILEQRKEPRYTRNYVSIPVNLRMIWPMLLGLNDPININGEDFRMSKKTVGLRSGGFGMSREFRWDVEEV